MRSIGPIHLGVLIIIMALLAVWAQVPTSPKGADAPETEFSATRAMKNLTYLLPQNIPHPGGSAENERTRARLLEAFGALGIETRTETRTICNGGRSGGQFFGCTDVTNVIAAIAPAAATDAGNKPVVLLAHYDSVAASPGAGDDLSGVSIILEVARILKAEGSFNNPIVALITDGEEDGLFGARAHFTDAGHVSQTGVVINMESRGNQGPSLLFETSDNGAWLVDLLAESGGGLITNSLMQAAYKQLPNDTDLTESIAAGLPGVNFAFAGNVAHYHTPLDNRENLSNASLQHQGDNVLNAARALANADLDNPPAGEAVYIDILSLFVMRISALFALPLAIVALLLVGVTARTLSNAAPPRWGAVAVGVVLVPLTLALAVGAGFAIDFIAGLFGEPSPGYATPMPLRLALFAGVAAAMLALSLSIGRWLGPVISLVSVWGTYAVAAAVAAVLLPGASVVFLFPAVFASLLFAVGAFFMKRAGSSALAPRLPFVAAGFLMLLLFPAVGLFETMFGLSAHFLVATPLALALMGCVPLVAAWADGGSPIKYRWQTAGGMGVFGVALAVVAGLMPSFDAWRPQRMNIEHFTDMRADAVGDRSQWRLSGWGTPILPDEFRAAADFSDERAPGQLGFNRSAFVAPAPVDERTAPAAHVVDMVLDGETRKIHLAFDITEDMRGMMVAIPNAAAPKGFAYTDGSQAHEFAEGGDEDGVKRFFCIASACRDVTFTVGREEGEAAAPWLVYSVRWGLPDSGEAIKSARPDWTVPVQAGDVTTVLGEIDFSRN